MMDIDAGKYYLLDDIAAVVWDRLETPTPVADLVSELCSRYDVTSERCEADVVPFLTELHEKGLVQQA
jgi:Coenzyme PQQ synthesis protein D (PqqD)